MDPTRSVDVLRHLEKQNELLQNAHEKMNLEMHKLQVEQEMLMRKFYQVMTALDHTKKGGGTASATTIGDQVQTESTSDI